MAKIEFQERTTADVKVAGRSIASAPPVGVPVGPRGFPPPPPPPPPAPVPVFTQDMALGIAFAVLVTDQPCTLVGTPGLIADPDGTPFVCDFAQQVEPRVIVVGFTGVSFAFATTVRVPANDPAITNADGTSLVAGDYTVWVVS